MDAGSLVLVGSLYLLVGLGAALFLCVEPSDESWLGSLALFLFYTLPERCDAAARRVLPKRFVDAGAGALDYVFQQRNPLLQVFYLVVVLGGYAAFVMFEHPEIPNRYIAEYHKTTGFLTILLCLLTFGLASAKGPGVVDQDSVELYAKCYPADGIIYDPERFCETCQLKRPARSKHCRLCGHCVPRFDHHCPWINTCVGQENLPFFLIFLVVHCGMLFYGTFVLGGTLTSVVVSKDLLNATFYSGKTRQSFKATPMLVVKYLMFHHGSLFGLLLLCAVMGVVLAGFAGYHIYLNCINQTTNETYKWADVRKYHKKFVKEYEAWVKAGGVPASDAAPAAGAEATAGIAKGSGRGKEDSDGSENADGGGKSNGSNGNGNGNANGAEATAPKEGAERSGGLAEDEGNGVNGHAEGEEAPPAAPRPPVNPGKVPGNAYSKGVLRNLSEAWYPLSWRQGFRESGGPPGKVQADGKKSDAARRRRRKKNK